MARLDLGLICGCNRCADLSRSSAFHREDSTLSETPTAKMVASGAGPSGESWSLAAALVASEFDSEE